MMIETYKNDLPETHPFLEETFCQELAIDTETMGLVQGRDRLCLVQLSSGDGRVVLIHFPVRGPSKSPGLEKLLQNDRIGKIFHFARFDLLTLQNHFNEPVKGAIFCTKIASKLARTYTDKHGLKELTQNLLCVEISKEFRASDWGADTLLEEQKIYAASDVLYLHALKEKLTEMLKREDRWKVAEALFSFLPLVVELDRKGFSIDTLLSH